MLCVVSKCIPKRKGSKDNELQEYFSLCIFLSIATCFLLCVFF